MADIKLSKSAAFPFWLSGSGTITVRVQAPNPAQPLDPMGPDLIDVSFGARGGEDFGFGIPGTVKLAIRAGTSAKLTPVWSGSSKAKLDVLAAHGLDKYLAGHPDEMILGLQLKASADASAAGSFRYSALTASAALHAGSDAGYEYFRAFPAATPLEKLAEDFFSGVKLPAQLTTAPRPGESISFEYGGYLKFGADVALGYEVKGTPSLDISQIHLSEDYRLSILGKLSLAGSVAGNFAVEARAALDESGNLLPGWVNVIVRRRRVSELKVAADAGVTIGGDLQGLPDNGRDFLGALLGVNAKNWLNLAGRVLDLSDIEQAKQELDSLAKNFLSEWIGKAFDLLSKTEFDDFLPEIQKVIDSYRSLDNTAITLFDQYFDKLQILTVALNKLRALTSWDQLKDRIDGELWEVLRRLTDGDPLGWVLGKIEIAKPDGGKEAIPSLPQLLQRVQQTLDLIEGDAHARIRQFIALAKSKFALNGFLNDLAAVDSIPDLKALASTKLGGFIERLIGKGIDQVKKSELDAVLQRIVRADGFAQDLYNKFKESAKQSFSFKLHAEYSRASENDALIDVLIDLNDARGKDIYQAAARGDFQDVLSAFNPAIVKLKHGILTHQVTKESAFSINVAGWHSGWHYQGLDRVILNTAQQISAENNGALTVFTSVDVTAEKERKQNGERMYTNFLLRFIGESHGVLQFDARNRQYLIDTITKIAAKYRLSFDDPHTQRTEIDYYLSFASDFGLAAGGATAAALLPLLPLVRAGVDDYGPVSVDYEVSYTEAGLRDIFVVPIDGSAIRLIMRKLVLASYLRLPGMENLGWAYWTQGVYDEWKNGPAAFTNRSQLPVRGLRRSPFAQQAAPFNLTLSKRELIILNKLYSIEDKFTVGLMRLQTLVRGGPIAPHDFEHALGDITSALQDLEHSEAPVNALFAVFDQLARLQAGREPTRASSLKIVSQVEGKQVSKIFIAQPAGSGQQIVRGIGSTT